MGMHAPLRPAVSAAAVRMHAPLRPAMKAEMPLPQPNFNHTALPAVSAGAIWPPDTMSMHAGMLIQVPID